MENGRARVFSIMGESSVESSSSRIFSEPPASTCVMVKFVGRQFDGP